VSGERSDEAIRVEWREGLDRFPHLRWRLDGEAFAAFRRFGEERTLAPGDVVFEEDAPSFSIFLVMAGEVAIERGGVEVARIPTNHSFGELGLLRDAPRSGAARAVGDVHLLELSRQGLHRMLEEAPLWAARLYRVLAESLAEYLHRSQPAGEDA
jgi:NTE family protein